jgi:heme-degrading monooxygenase HmoA
VFNISAANDVVTLINVFTVDPEDQRELVHRLSGATEVMKRMPGFVSTSIHRSLDGRHVANYAQWRSEADFKAMLKNPMAQEHMAAASELGSAEPVLYEVIGTTFEPNPSPPIKP